MAKIVHQISYEHVFDKEVNKSRQGPEKSNDLLVVSQEACLGFFVGVLCDPLSTNTILC